MRRRIKSAGEDHPSEHEPPGSKLAPYLDAIAERVELGLTNRRILREIRAKGYTGGSTVLGEHIRTLRGPRRKASKAHPRIEEVPGKEAQVDWSPYQVTIAGVERAVHCFSMVLRHSRMLFMQCHRDEQLPTLLAAHVDALTYFQGVTEKIVYDNMTTVTLGRRGNEPIWHPRFQDFARHWSFTPFACKVNHKDRKGNVESGFSYFEQDFLRGKKFESWADLDQQLQGWLDAEANPRTHETINEVPRERWELEKQVLTPLPATPFPTYREETRSVYIDCTISVGGHRYTVPPHLVRTTVSVHVHPRHIEILDARGTLQATHSIPDRKGGIVIDPTHYDSLLRPGPQAATTLARGFLALFPDGAEFLDGLKERMKTFHPVHLRKLSKLVRTFGIEHVREAMATATRGRNFNANAVERILVREHPLLAVEPPYEDCVTTPNLEGLVDVDEASLDEYDADIRGGEEATDSTGSTAPDATTEDHPHHEDDDHATQNTTIG